MAQPEGAQRNIRWYALDVELEPDAHEAVEYALMEAGGLGTETNDRVDGLLQVIGYFGSRPDRERVREELLEALRIYSLPSSVVREINAREIADQDWLAEWKKNWQPVVGGKFIIAPPWTELSQTHNHLIIRIEPGMAFGTGTHETTRLCLAAIEKYFAGGSFLDVGTGTGILAIAAAKLFPDAHIEACDTDGESIKIARENARVNHVAIDFRVGSVEDQTASADLVCANLTADLILKILPALINVTCGRLIVSGILDTQTESVLAGLSDCGITEVEITHDGEWVLMII